MMIMTVCKKIKTEKEDAAARYNGNQYNSLTVRHNFFEVAFRVRLPIITA